MASRAVAKLGPVLAALLWIGHSLVAGLSRARALHAGVLHDAPWARALEAGHRLDAGHLAGITFGSEVGPAQQGAAAIALGLGGPAGGAALLCALSGSMAVLGALLMTREVALPARIPVMLATALLALRADVLALPGLALLWVALLAARPNARPEHGWRAGAVLLLAVLWTPWASVSAAFLVGVAALHRPRLALRAGVVLVVGVLLLVALSLAAGSLEVSTWLSFDPSPSGNWALVLWLFGAWIVLARGSAAVRGTHLPILLAAATISLLAGPDAYALVWPSAAGALFVAASRDVPQTVRIGSALGATVLLLAEVAAPVVHVLPALSARPDPSPLAVEDRMIAWIDGGEGCVAYLGDLGYAAVRSRATVVPLAEGVACPRAVVRGRSADPALDSLLSRYEPVVRLGVYAFGLRRRSAPTRVVGAGLLDAFDAGGPCDRTREIRDVFTSPGQSVRVSDEGFAIAPGRATLDALVSACDGACLFAEVGVVGDSGTFEVTLAAERGGRSVELVRRSIGPGFRQPIEVPIEAGALALRFAFEGDAPVVLRKPRVGPCVSQISIVNALHEGLARRVPADAAIALEGDELRIPIFEQRSTPVRVELDVSLSAATEPCLAVELAVRDRRSSAGLLAGVERGGQLYWLGRLVVEPGGPHRLLADLPLAGFAGDSTLMFSAWPIGREAGGVAVFTRPRVYRCGENPGWAF